MVCVMATKTISVDLDAYAALCRARVAKRESFSQVIKRAQWVRRGKTCGELLATLPGMPPASEAVIGRLQAAQNADQPPDHPRQ